MECDKCKKIKLSREFPEEPPTDGCIHPAHFCLACMVKFLEVRTKCPSSNCNEDVEKGKIDEYREELNFLFPEPVDAGLPASAITTSPNSGQQFVVAMLVNGEHRNITFSKNLSITDLKSDIEKKLGPKASKQKLRFGDTELKDRTVEGGRATLGMYGVKAGSTIRVMVQLCEVPVGMEDAVFDLHWGYPNHGRDYLDATALFFQSKEDTPLILDYQIRPPALALAATHSGDIMDDLNSTGHHKIIIKSFEKLLPTMKSIFFVLSAWNSPHISHFKRPALKFYSNAEPHKLLCRNHVKDLPQVQAVIMCRVDKDALGVWTVYDMGNYSAGNATNYDPIIATIRQHL